MVDACDFSYPPPTEAGLIIARIRERIGKPTREAPHRAGSFDVLDEQTSASAAAAGVGSQWTGSHLHIEYDPIPSGG